jgi:hypothetical protein
MEEMNPAAFLEMNPPTRNLSDIFQPRGEVQDVEQVLIGLRTVTDRDSPGYYWPCETDPHAEEVLAYVKEHSRQLFPNTFAQTNP